MKERAILVSWGQVPRGREAKALEVFREAHTYLKKGKEARRFIFNIYFNAQGADLAGFMLIHGQPESLFQEADKLEELYMKASAVVDNLSLKMLVGGTEQGIEEHLDSWAGVQKNMGYI